MRVLILGINGFIGRSITAFSNTLGHEVFGISRSNEVQQATCFKVNRENVKDVRRVVIDNKIEVVVDVIAMTPTNTLPLLEELASLRDHVSHYVLISSCDVYAEYELFHKLTGGQASRNILDETTPLRTTRYPYRGEKPRETTDPQAFLDDYDKLPIEAAVQDLSLAWTILRLPMVYGPGDRQARFRWAIKPILEAKLEGRQEINFPAAWMNWESTYGYIENVGAAIASTLGEARAYNQIFNIADKAQGTQRFWAEQIARRLGWSGSLTGTDEDQGPQWRHLNQLDLAVPLRVGADKFRRMLEFEDIIDIADALDRTIASERKP